MNIFLRVETMAPLSSMSNILPAWEWKILRRRTHSSAAGTVCNGDVLYWCLRDLYFILTRSRLQWGADTIIFPSNSVNLSHVTLKIKIPTILWIIFKESGTGDSFEAKMKRMSRNAFSAADVECEWGQSKRMCLQERERVRERKRHAASLSRFGPSRRMN